MLVIKDLFEEVKADDKKRFYKKNKYAKKVEFIRYTDYINNKPFYIIDVNKSYIKAESVQKLLSVFKGNVIVNESLETEIFKEYLFDERDYVIRSLLSALLRIILYEKEIKSIYINLNNIKRSNLNDRSVVFEEIYSIVKYVKNINIVFKPDFQLDLLRENCFRQFGTVINSFDSENYFGYDAYIDMNNTDENGRCEMYLKGKSCILYPDCSYFEIDDDVRKLLAYGVNRKVACAICNSKKT